MDTLIMVSIMTLVLFVSSGSARAATLIVSNQMQRRANVPVFVTCQGSIPRMSKPIPLGQRKKMRLMISHPPLKKNDKPARPRVSQRTSCEGTFWGEAQFVPSLRMYRLYDSDTDSAVRFVVAKDDGFYCWNNDKNYWHKCPMIIFI
uniref:S-protein homolog n=1 Tax=Brassica campestris TaxID=3711 RepID=A0A3P6A2K8_BRACM|nr:unnamed protein product [Brassica rapa]